MQAVAEHPFQPAAQAEPGQGQFPVVGEHLVAVVKPVELGGQRIRINAIAPGMILTPMNLKAETDAKFLDAADDHIPWGRAGKAEEVAALAVYLSSDKADYITGAVVTIDGGLTLEQALGA